jgi:hypothetical protein
MEGIRPSFIEWSGSVLCSDDPATGLYPKTLYSCYALPQVLLSVVIFILSSISISQVVSYTDVSFFPFVPRGLPCILLFLIAVIRFGSE